MAELLAITKTTRAASIAGDLFTAKKNNALQDATKSLAIQTLLAGYIAKGIALCGQQLLDDVRTTFDLAFTFIQGNMDAIAFLYLIKAN
ncbi:uncharacterized protein F5147DRAFT_781237 [Suillus discolor]|uniref:Uncharacterized protein n=1 Tax=Suillus discolor TaxID=1912936 RepID=A0A9P7ES29_9AGAM|nr:uncharacterized protein F5147DRAFT_781237 [Suillus discolor]KAG2087708.1 hypothetical protein F5147DRAFT_781237 [Suillus discolor]